MTLHDRAKALDERDELAKFKDQFVLREGLVYLDGNSLGALPKQTEKRMAEVVSREWGKGLITSWTEADWIHAPQRIGDKIAPLIGAQEGEVIVADSTSINIFKALAAALSIQEGRSTLLTEQGSFPTDHYMMQGLSRFSNGRIESVAVETDELLENLDESVAALLLTHVHYRTGSMHDMARITEKAHEVGALVIWDLSHSTGAVEIDLEGAQTDFAVGCGYKFLNGGPGAPAYIYVAKRHQHASPILSGWFGHQQPFAFEETYQPADGIGRFQAGTPTVLGMAALESGVDLVAKAGLASIRAKSAAMGDFLIEALRPLCAEFGLELVTPALADLRGSQISFSHARSYAMTQALKARDVIGDFRTPDVMRFGLTPLYVGFADLVKAGEKLRIVCEGREWDRPEYCEMATVT